VGTAHQVPGTASEQEDWSAVPTTVLLAANLTFSRAVVKKSPAQRQSKSNFWQPRTSSTSVRRSNMPHAIIVVRRRGRSQVGWTPPTNPVPLLGGATALRCYAFGLSDTAPRHLFLYRGRLPTSYSVSWWAVPTLLLLLFQYAAAGSSHVSRIGRATCGEATARQETLRVRTAGLPTAGRKLVS